MEFSTKQQGTFAFLPALDDAGVRKQIEWVVDQGYAVSVEYTDDPHPCNNLWKMWGLPMFDIEDVATVTYEFEACREAFPDYHIKINGYDPGRQGQIVSFVAHWPNT